jgi:hypothetical protein
VPPVSTLRPITPNLMRPYFTPKRIHVCILGREYMRMEEAESRNKSVGSSSVLITRAENKCLLR